MKKDKWFILCIGLLAAVSTAFAADTNTNSTSLYSGNEFRVDTFATYTSLKDAGAGVGVTYFLTRNVGATIYTSKTDFDNNKSFMENANLALIYRVPITDVLAPYLTVGGKWFDADRRNFEPDVNWDLFAGGGVEYRITKKFGAFAEAVYEFPDWQTVGKEGTTVRGGLRFGF